MSAGIDGDVESVPTLRRATPADAAAIAAIHVRSRVATYRGLVDDAYLDVRMPAEMPPFWRARMAALEAGAGAAWLVEQAGVAFAFACAEAPDADGSVLVDNLHALPGRKGGGAGTRLLDEVARWAGSQGATRLHLLVLEGNAGAIGFYEHRGWRCVERLEDVMDGNDVVALKYVRDLASA